MYRITNIAASRSEGCWHHLLNNKSPESHTLQFEPWVAGMQLKLYETRVITDQQYQTCKDVIDELITHRIIKVNCLNLPVVPTEEPAVEKAEKTSPKLFEFSLDKAEDEPAVAQVKQETFVAPKKSYEYNKRKSHK